MDPMQVLLSRAPQPQRGCVRKRRGALRMERQLGILRSLSHDGCSNVPSSRLHSRLTVIDRPNHSACSTIHGTGTIAVAHCDSPVAPPRYAPRSERNLAVIATRRLLSKSSLRASLQAQPSLSRNSVSVPLTFGAESKCPLGITRPTNLVHRIT
jgi:hypothetical protein